MHTLTINFDDLQGRTPLHHAASVDDLETIKLLLHHGAKATATDYQVYHKQICQQLQEDVTANSFLVCLLLWPMHSCQG